MLSKGVPVFDDHGGLTGWAGLNIDIRTLKLSEQALREADRRKDEFLATLAHGLRNPLAPIRHAVRLLESSATGERQREWARAVIARQSKHMALLVDDLLDVSRITRGQLELRPEWVTLTSIVEAAVEVARPQVEAKQHTLSVTMPPSAVELLADRLRVSQVISNLLTNAAKYTDRGGCLEVAVAAPADEITISVRDNGIGLAPEVIPGLFAMFSQVARRSTAQRAASGSGSLS